MVQQEFLIRKLYEGWLKCDAQLHITCKWKEISKWKSNEYDVKVHFICYKNVHSFFCKMLLLCSYHLHFLPLVNQFSYSVNEEYWLDGLYLIQSENWRVPNLVKTEGVEIDSNFNFTRGLEFQCGVWCFIWQ